jgi:hypothetical protein
MWHRETQNKIDTACNKESTSPEAVSDEGAVDHTFALLSQRLLTLLRTLGLQRSLKDPTETHRVSVFCSRSNGLYL